MIKTNEQYESAKDLGHLFNKLGLGQSLFDNVIYEHGGDFEECEDGCGDVINCCSCEKNMEYSNPYSDDDSFE